MIDHADHNAKEMMKVDGVEIQTTVTLGNCLKPVNTEAPLTGPLTIDKSLTMHFLRGFVNLYKIEEQERQERQ